MDWTAVAAIATAASAVVVAFQTYWTRQAAEKTADAAVATRLSADGTRAALVEAAKARLDARAPRVRVVLDPPGGVVYEPSVAGGDPQPVTGDPIFRTPKDRDHLLGAVLEGVIVNTGDDLVVIQLNAPLVVTHREPGAHAVALGSATQVRLRPEASVRFRLSDARPLHQWIDNWVSAQGLQAPDPQPKPAVIVAEIICSDAYDDGVIDRWRIELTGHPVQPVTGEDGSWKIRGLPGLPPPPDLFGSSLIHQRVYYRSKSRKEVLAE